jgi:hypothetical protein
VVEGDAGAGERVLDGGRDAVGVAVGGDGEGPAVVHLHERRAYVLRDRVRVAPLWRRAVLYVPPHRRLRPHVLRLRHRRRRSVHIPNHPRAQLIIKLQHQSINHSLESTILSLSLSLSLRRFLLYTFCVLGLHPFVLF